MAMIKLNINLSEDIWEWLDKENKRTGMSKSALIASALEVQRTQKAFMEAMPILEKMMNTINADDSKA